MGDRGKVRGDGGGGRGVDSGDEQRERGGRWRGEWEREAEGGGR